MHREESQTDLGAIKIHKNVIASIASLAAAEIEGVKRIGGSFKSGLLEFMGQKPSTSICVLFDNNGEVTVEVPIIIKYGFNIPEIANKAQENICKAIEKMTNLTVKNINIKVQVIEKD